MTHVTVINQRERRTTMWETSITASIGSGYVTRVHCFLYFLFCMYVCMYVFIYPCICLCIYAFVCKYVCMYVCMYACMHS